jgi:ADP-ribosylglycohydrolase
MRAAPVGLYFFDDDDALVRVAAAQSVLTHSHPTGIASSVAAAAPVAWVARGNGLDGMLPHTVAMVEKLTAELLRDLGARPSDVDRIGVGEQLRILERTEQMLARDDDDVCRLLGGAWVGEEAVACALWCVLKAEGDFEASIGRGANSSGDSDSIACIAGSIAGAHVGIARLPARFVERVERGADLDALARQLFEARERDLPSLPGALDFFDAELI